MAALGLDSLPDNRVVLCADKRVAPPVGRAKDVQQLGLDGIDVLEPLFQGVLLFVSRPHDSHRYSSVVLGITGLRQQRTSRDPLSFTSTRIGPRSVHFDGCTRERREPGVVRSWQWPVGATSVSTAATAPSPWQAREIISISPVDDHA